MESPKLTYPSVENQLHDALQAYFYKIIGGSSEDFSKWFESIGRVTDGWKMMDMNRKETQKINKEYDVPEWFMLAIHATI